jgi:hypothetical protein
MKHAAKLTHHASYQYNINKTMCYKIEFFCDKLKPDSGIKWEMPIAHLITQTPFATTIRDSSLEGAGEFSTTLEFWWHIHFWCGARLSASKNTSNNLILRLFLCHFLHTMSS